MMRLGTALCALLAGSLRGILAHDRAVPDTISILHVNDVHAHLDEFNEYGTECSAAQTQPRDRRRRAVEAPDPNLATRDAPCQGGYARIKAAVDAARRRFPNETLLLNAGDEAQGTMYYTYYKGSVTADLLNQLDFDAHTSGNHEWDDGALHFGSYIHNLTAPVVCANVRSQKPGVTEDLLKYTLVERLGVAVIGFVTPDTRETSSPGPDVSFVEPIELAQSLVNEVRELGYRRVILLTHIGYDRDQELVRKLRGVSVVVGGHSHTFLGDLPHSSGPYPTFVRDLDGHDVPIVTAGKWGYMLGHLRVKFDEQGRARHTENHLVRLTSDQPQDADWVKQIKAWRRPFDEFAREVVGRARKAFSQLVCQVTECSIGNLVAEAMLAAHPHTDLAIVNAGGLRAGIPRGNITRSTVLTVLPFSSRLVDLELSGEALAKTIEGIVSWRNQDTGHETTSFMQIAGMRVVYHSSKPRGQRLQDLSIRNATGGFELVELTRRYKVCTLDFMAKGGDFWWSEKQDFVAGETVDEALIDYLKSQPRGVTPVLDRRIRDLSASGKVKQHAEGFLWLLEKLVFGIVALLGPGDSAGSKVFDLLASTVLLQFEGGDFR